MELQGRTAVVTGAASGIGLALTERCLAEGMNPADVAAAVLYAVRANRFWIITHQVTQDRIRRRNADLETGRIARAPGS